MTSESRGDRTRNRLLDVAERLFADQGVFNTSLRQIRVAAGERNTTATQYHFRDLDGVIAALTNRHLPHIAERQRTVWQHVVDDHATNEPNRLAQVLVRPPAEYLELGQQQRAWIKIMAELASSPELYWRQVLALPSEVEAARSLYRNVKTFVPARVARERMFIVMRMSLNVCADRARRIDDPDERGKPLSTKLFVTNLTAMGCGALFAPITETLD